ncbi:bifunctional metallophosphatase/5'-nucleotidase [Myxococcota bacterium]|nr:bifunctional metallophosphatase/5'-nucleotidase [Myxococcota bacterium]
MSFRDAGLPGRAPHVRSTLAALTLFALLGAACGSTKGAATGPDQDALKSATSTATAAASDAAKAASDATKAATDDAKAARIQVFALSDFHGWLHPLEPRAFAKYYGGIANFGGQLRHKEKATPESSLILDNGDMFTGPTESTFLRGEPVIEAYNALGVAAVNIANHEFDFGLEILRARIAEAKFPFLGANIVEAGTNKPVDFAKPYVIVERQGVKVAIIGLAFADTPKTTFAKHVRGLEFQPYAPTLKRVVPEVRAQGAEVVVVLFHDVVDVIEKTMREVGDLGIQAIVAGQNHRKEQAVVGGTPIVNPGPFGRSYVRFDIEVDRATRKVSSVKHEIVDITGDVGAPAFPPSPELVAIAESARQRVKQSGEVLGRLAKPLPVGSFADTPLGHFVVDAWLTALPDVDVAICNHGALRQPLPSGPVTAGDLISVLPFENNLYVVEITGKQLISQLAIDSPIVGGITWTYKEGKDGARTVVSVVDRVGKPLDPNKKYRVAINDFMYTGGDGFQFRDLDGAPEDTGMSWRQPVIRLLRQNEAGARKTEPQSSARAKHVH